MFKFLFNKYISLTAIIVICVCIFIFSHQTGDVSADLNDNYFIRKLAHFSEYAILGFFTYSYISNIIKDKRLEIFYPLIFIVFYALSDEFHQLFIPGRSGNIIDVVIDSSGGLFGIFISKKIKKLLFKTSSHK